MAELHEIARDVAAALVLEWAPDADPYNGWWRDEASTLNEDGSNLTDPYWRCRCEDWLHSNAWSMTFAPTWMEAWKMGTNIELHRPLSLAPAALVSAVWRKQNAKT